MGGSNFAMERLQKVLASAGIASRRKCEELIQDGRVKVNDTIVTTLGFKVDPASDIISIDEELIQFPAQKIHIMLNKPKGYLSTVNDDRGRPTVMDLVGKNWGRLFPMGRLDKDSEGLLLLTNDGSLTSQLTHPRSAPEKEYLVQASGKLSQDSLNRLRKGICIDGRLAVPEVVEAIRGADVENGSPHSSWVRIVLREGRKRQIRKMLAAVGYRAIRLIRIRIGPLYLGHLQPGSFRSLTAVELEQLRSSAGLPKFKP